MRLIVPDAGLADFRGHHFTYNAAVAREAGRRGIAVEFYVNRNAEAGAVESLGARRHFAHLGFARLGELPESPAKDFANDCLRANRDFLADFERLLIRTAPEDAVFLHSASHHQILGFAQALQALPAERRPRTSVLLRYADFDLIGHQVYRIALPVLTHPALRTRLLTDTEALATVYRELSGAEVAVAPIPHAAAESGLGQRSLPGFDGLSIGFAGFSSAMKGFHFLSGLVDRARSGRLSVRFLVQIGEPGSAAPPIAAEIAALRARAAGDLLLFEGSLAAADYRALLSASDIVLALYDPAVYAYQSSGVFVEALAEGKVTLVPAGTWMAQELAKLGGGEAFEPYGLDGIWAGLNRAVVGYARLAAEARAAAGPWRAFHTPERLLDMVLWR